MSDYVNAEFVLTKKAAFCLMSVWCYNIRSQMNGISLHWKATLFTVTIFVIRHQWASRYIRHVVWWVPTLDYFYCSGPAGRLRHFVCQFVVSTRQLFFPIGCRLWGWCEIESSPLPLAHHFGFPSDGWHHLIRSERFQAWHAPNFTFHRIKAQCFAAAGSGDKTNIGRRAFPNVIICSINSRIFCLRRRRGRLSFF